MRYISYSMPRAAMVVLPQPMAPPRMTSTGTFGPSNISINASRHFGKSSLVGSPPT